MIRREFASLKLGAGQISFIYRLAIVEFLLGVAEVFDKPLVMYIFKLGVAT
jgi:hypothetical protein